MLDLIPSELLQPTAKKKMWAESPFKDFESLHPKTKGGRGEQIAEAILSAKGEDVTPRCNSDHDIVVNGVTTEIKTSCMSEKGVYSFLQVRPSQDYEQILFLCVSPQNIRMFFMDKETIMENIEEGALRKQHGGKKGDGITYLFYPTEQDLLDMGAFEYV